MSKAILHALKGNKTSPIPQQSLGAAVVEHLRDKILANCAKANNFARTPLSPKSKPAAFLSAKRSSHLAAAGLVTIVANRGALVSALSPEELMELFETRAALECYRLRCAIPGMRPEDFRRAEDILRNYEESLERDTEVESSGRLNWSFHSALCATANRPKMFALVKNLNVNCDRYTRLHVVVTRDQHRAGQPHRGLLEVCKTKDPELAAAAMWKHITDAGHYLKEFIKRHREQL